MDLRLYSTPLTQSAKTAVVSVAEVKLQARILSADEDALVASDIETAYDYLSGAAGWLGRCCLLEEEFEFYVGSSQRGPIELPMRPFAGPSVTAFDMVQADGSYAALPTPTFRLVPRETHGSLFGVDGTPWPYYGSFHPRAYRVRFKAGFGTEQAAIPSGIRKAIKMLAAHWYANRETVSKDGVTPGSQIEYGLRALCGRYRISPDHS